MPELVLVALELLPWRWTAMPELVLVVLGLFLGLADLDNGAVFERPPERLARS